MLTLHEQEQIIEDNIKPFVRAGQALLEIRNNWDTYSEDAGFDKFSEYLKHRWADQLPTSTIYQQLNVIEVNAMLPEPVVKDSHATALHRFLGDDKALINAAWNEVNQTTDKPTAEYVATVAKKHWLMAHGEKLGELVRFGQITPDKAYNLCLVLENLPEYYVDAVYNFGIGEDCVSGDTLRAIRNLENNDQAMALDILRSGMLNDTFLWQLTPNDVATFTRRLSIEKTRQQQLKVSDKQKAETKSGVKILDGLDVWNIDDSPTLYYLFPNGHLAPNELSKILEKNNMKVFFVVAYPENNPPDINFDGKPVNPSEIINKPKNLINYINNSTI